jgi:hypothetical protein
MTVHLIKLCVGVETPRDLAEWQAERFKRLVRTGKTPEHCHRTRHMPRRRAELLSGGSLYWVIKSFVLVRQRVLDLRADVKDDGTSCCGIVLDSELVPTRPQPRRAFQGWRYLETSDAPPDATGFSDEAEEMPRAMREALRELRLIDW